MRTLKTTDSAGSRKIFQEGTWRESKRSRMSGDVEGIGLYLCATVEELHLTSPDTYERFKAVVIMALGCHLGPVDNSKENRVGGKSIS